MPGAVELIGLLADGRWHSGADLARRLGCSRTAVWKQFHRLPELGLAADADRLRGYRLDRPLELLDATRIRAALQPATRERLHALDLEPVTRSTSLRLREGPAAPPGRFHAALAEYQTEGRGRRGRSWVSAFGSGICLSVGTVMSRRPAGMSALGLALGVAVQRALAAAGARDLGLKWPNDILADDRKLVGLLTEVEGEADGPLRLIVGVGLNLRAPDPARLTAAGPALPPVGLAELLEDPPSRNRLAAGLIDELLAAMTRFASEGFGAFADEWRSLDVLRDRPVEVHRHDGVLRGVARGIDEHGHLLVATGSRLETVVAGDVSVRWR